MSRFMNTTAARTVISIWSWFVIGVVVILWFPMVAVVRLVTMPFDPGAYAAGYLFRKLCVVHQKLTPLWKFTVTGSVPDDPRRPYVVVANHESFVDILLISHLPMEMKWLSKAEFFKIPLVGWMMKLATDIPVRRGERDSAIEALRQCRLRLERKVSVMVFPEGTRSKTGELQPFKDGAFSTAIAAGVPILPLAVHGTKTALRKSDWRLGYSSAEVRVLEPVPTDGLGPGDVADLRERVRDLIATELDDLRAGT
jgi:1-acyl-sn-glycerol-3-phosphate acyltransferase